MERKQKHPARDFLTALVMRAVFLIYILTFIYGAAVMRGVMEEKTNRIAEVIISSVKPFQLMFGKITGIGAVGLTQFVMWIILIVTLVSVAQAFIPHEYINGGETDTGSKQYGQRICCKSKRSSTKNICSEKYTCQLPTGDLSYFAFYFIFLEDIFFIHHLFASVGSVVNEDPQEAQSLMLPITMPIIFSFHHHVDGGTGSDWSAGSLGKHDPIQFTNCYDGAYSLWRSKHSSLVATGIVHVTISSWIFIHHLDGRKNLSHRHFNVWKKTNVGRRCGNGR